MDRKSKEVRMSAKETTGKTSGNEQSQKLSYEQLEKIAMDLNMQRNQLQMQLQKAEQVINEFNDLGMLLSIVKAGENFSSGFIARCTDRIEKIVSTALDNYDSMEKEMKTAKEGQEASTDSAVGDD